MKIIPLHGREGVKKLGGRASCRASCGKDLLGRSPSRSRPVLNFFTPPGVQEWVVPKRQDPPRRLRLLPPPRRGFSRKVSDNSEIVLFDLARDVNRDADGGW